MRTRVLPLRFVVAVMALFSVAVLILGCIMGCARLTPQPSSVLKAGQTKVVLGPSYSATDLTNSRSEGGRVINGPTNEVFAPYDTHFVGVIEQHWFELVDQSSGARKEKGEVRVVFRLHEDGHITGLQVTRSTVGEEAALICQKAITQCVPFTPWPQELRQLVTNNFRPISFTFYFDR